MLKVFTKLLIQPEFLLILISCQDTHIYTINLLVLQDFHELMMVTLFQMLTCYVTFLFLTLGDFNRLFILFFIYLGNYIILLSLISVDLYLLQIVLNCLFCIFILYSHQPFRKKRKFLRMRLPTLLSSDECLPVTLTWM